MFRVLDVIRWVEYGTNTKLIEIHKISPEAPVSPEYKNQAQKEHDNSGDILSGNSLSSEISPEINGGNQAQKQQSVDTGDTGNILHMPTGTLVTGLDISVKEPYDNGKGKQEEDDEKPIVVQKFGSSTPHNGYVNNQSCEDKPTTVTISVLRTNDSVAATTTTAISTNDAIYLLGGTDTWACKNCKIKADKHLFFFTAVANIAFTA